VRQDPDAAAPNNSPVILVRAGRHSTVGNSAALQLAGITRDAPLSFFERGVLSLHRIFECNLRARQPVNVWTSPIGD
jgi:hypothetical protein